MKNPKKAPFETYRKQARSLKVNRATREKTLATIKQMEQEIEANKHAAIRTPRQKKTAAPQTVRRSHLVALPLKIAACLALIAGVGSIALFPFLPQEETEQQAIAGSPILPFYRIYLDFNQGGGQLDSHGKLVDTVPFFISLPGNLPDTYTLRFKGTDDVFFIPRGATLNESSRNNVIRVTGNSAGRVCLDAAYSTGLSPEEKLHHEEERFGEDDLGYSAVGAVEFIKRLRNCEISIEAGGHTLDTYTIDFGDFEYCQTDEEIVEQLRAHSDSMTFFALERKGTP